MDERDVVVAADYIAQGGEAFFYALDFYAGGERVAEVLEFLVGCCCRDEEAFAVSEHTALACAFGFWLSFCGFAGFVGLSAGNGGGLTQQLTFPRSSSQQW